MNTLKEKISSFYKANPIAFIFCVILLFLLVHVTVFKMADSTPGRHRILTEGIKNDVSWDSIYYMYRNYGK